MQCLCPKSKDIWDLILTPRLILSLSVAEFENPKMKLSHWVSAANTLNAGIYSPSLLCVWIPCSCLWGTYTLRDRLLKVQVHPCHPKHPRTSFPHRRKHFPTDGHSGICTFSWWLLLFSLCVHMCAEAREQLQASFLRLSSASFWDKASTDLSLAWQMRVAG